jgi:hypothetical protein
VKPGDICTLRPQRSGILTRDLPRAPVEYAGDVNKGALMLVLACQRVETTDGQGSERCFIITGDNTLGWTYADRLRCIV